MVHETAAQIRKPVSLGENTKVPLGWLIALAAFCLAAVVGVIGGGIWLGVMYQDAQANKAAVAEIKTLVVKQGEDVQAIKDRVLTLEVAGKRTP